MEENSEMPPVGKEKIVADPSSHLIACDIYLNKSDGK